MPDTMTVNDAEYAVLQLLGKERGGCSCPAGLNIDYNKKELSDFIGNQIALFL